MKHLIACLCLSIISLFPHSSSLSAENMQQEVSPCFAEDELNDGIDDPCRRIDDGGLQVPPSANPSPEPTITASLPKPPCGDSLNPDPSSPFGCGNPTPPECGAPNTIINGCYTCQNDDAAGNPGPIKTCCDAGVRYPGSPGGCISAEPGDTGFCPGGSSSPTCGCLDCDCFKKPTEVERLECYKGIIKVIPAISDAPSYEKTTVIGEPKNITTLDGAKKYLEKLKDSSNRVGKTIKALQLQLESEGDHKVKAETLQKLKDAQGKKKNTAAAITRAEKRIKDLAKKGGQGKKPEKNLSY